MPRKKKAIKLTGEALLTKIKSMPGTAEVEKAKACGYLGESGRAMCVEFKNAILEAQGVNLDAVANGSGGRSPAYRLSVQANGNILIGSAYTDRMGLEPGMEFEVKLGRTKIALSLVG